MAEGPIGRRDRRRFLAGSGAGLIALAAPSLLRAQEPGDAAGAVRPIAVVPVGADAGRAAMKIAQSLREAGYHADLGYSGNMGKRMKRADKLNAIATVILGEDELARDAATVRDMQSGEQTEVPLKDLEAHLAKYR